MLIISVVLALLAVAGTVTAVSLDRHSSPTRPVSPAADSPSGLATTPSPSPIPTPCLDPAGHLLAPKIDADSKAVRSRLDNHQLSVALARLGRDMRALARLSHDPPLTRLLHRAARSFHRASQLIATGHLTQGGTDMLLAAAQTASAMDLANAAPLC